MATITVNLAAVATSLDATNPALVSRLVEDVANAINMGGAPVAGSGTLTTTIAELATTITYTVVKS